ncbi:hypothetical protein BGZ60DRAFT_372670 [Tricladium varicosporioides]|nr:hypothetical protein BGZ60DRAFT_372670 [Hymenoscyphus varicosporioides]
MSLPSPVDQYGNKVGGSGYGSSGQSDSGKSPLSMSLGFLKNLTEKKSTRVDGQPPKRRGPKPDSKPALTRRQELNRQAQRTHRERKELYIKALEQEVIRLKENFTDVSRSKETLAEENRQLKQLLAQHGIPWNGTGGVEELQNGTGYTSSGSISGSYAQDSQTYSPPPGANATMANAQYQNQIAQTGMNGRSMAQQQIQPGVDYDQAGIDFVLTLERPCMDHLGFLVGRANESEDLFSGHAMMASCPPVPEPEETMPFGHGPRHGHGNAQKTWDLSKSDLANLLDLSKRLNLEGEITPVMAWGMVLGHPRFSELRLQDFEKMALELRGKIRCYGFGAVLEEFELRDALANVLSDQDAQNHNDLDMMF